MSKAAKSQESPGVADVTLSSLFELRMPGQEFVDCMLLDILTVVTSFVYPSPNADNGGVLTEAVSPADEQVGLDFQDLLDREQGL